MATGSAQPFPPSPPPTPMPPPQQYTSAPITVILTLIILIFFFVGFFSIFFCRCFLQNLIQTWYLRRNPSAGPTDAVEKPPNGLDLSIVQSYPTFNYSSVKGYRREKYGLECAICLIEFEDVDVLRLLTPCCHVFHQECIDLWLESHKTCPVCRRDLASPVESPVKSCQILREIQEEEEEHSEDKDSFSITIKEDSRDYLDKMKDRQGCCGESKACKFSRSHSTGHSILEQEDDDDDRFTLRLPEHVKSNIMKGHHNCSRSWTTFGDYRSKVNKGVDEVSGVSSGDIHKL